MAALHSLAAHCHWLTAWLTVHAGLAFLPAAFLAIVATMAIALPLEVVLYSRIYRMGDLQQVLATIGIAFIMIAGVNLWLGSALLPIRLPEWMTGSIDLGFRTLPVHRVGVIVTGLVVIAGLYALIDRTRFGIHLRASVDHRGTASTLGINTDRIFALTFMLGAGLAALGGVLGAELLPIDAYYPLRYMILFLIVVAVGGLGSITGSFIAALGLGIVDTAARYIIPDFGAIAFFIVMMAVLALRPYGLLGRAET